MEAIRRELPWVLVCTLSGLAVAYGITHFEAPGAGSLALPALLAFVAVALWFALCVRSPGAAVAVLCMVVIFSSHVFALMNAAGIPAELLRNAILAKDAMAAILAFALILNAASQEGRFGPALKAMAYLTLVVAVLVAFGGQVSVLSQLTSIRGALIPLFALTIGGLLTNDMRLRAIRIIVPATSVAAVYALYEQLLAPEALLRQVLDIGSYWADVKGQEEFLDPYTGLPANFFTSQGYPRLSGTFGDPLSAGMVLGTVLCLAVIYAPHIRLPYFQVVILGVAFTATFTRGGWVIAACCLTAYVVQRYRARSIPILLSGGVFVAGVATVVSPIRNYVLGIVQGGDSSTLAHAAAFSGNLSASYPLLGSGWGTGGAATATTSAAQGVDVVTNESAFVALVAQTGLFIGLVMVVLIYSMTKGPTVAGFSWARRGLLFGLLVSSVVSENLLTFNGGFIPFLAVWLLTVAPAEVPEEATSQEHQPDERDHRVPGPLEHPRTFARRGHKELHA